jgi:hypothetical protein
MQKNIVMGKVLKAISISLLWMAGLGSAFANPGPGQEWRQEARAARPQPSMERPDAQRREQFQRQPDRRRGGPSNLPALHGPNAVGNNRFDVVPEMARRPGRLTPEERRALRRQINEAGRDIYFPRR